MWRQLKEFVTGREAMTSAFLNMFEKGGSQDGTAAAKKVTETLAGYKAATLEVQVVAGGQLVDYRFRSAVLHRYYKTDSIAQCRQQSHTPPEDNCICGFYALTSMARIWVGDHAGGRTKCKINGQILHVTLTGDVIQSTKGFRAGQQHVNRITFRDLCSVDACENKAEILGIGPNSVVSVDEDDEKRAVSGWSEIHTFCTEHSTEVHPITLGELAALTGIDVDMQSPPDGVPEVRQGTKTGKRIRISSAVAAGVVLFVAMSMFAVQVNLSDTQNVGLVGLVGLVYAFGILAPLFLYVLIPQLRGKAFSFLMIGVTLTVVLVLTGAGLKYTYDLQHATDRVMVGQGTLQDLETVLNQYNLENGQEAAWLGSRIYSVGDGQHPELVTERATAGQIGITIKEQITTITAPGLTPDGGEACIYIRSTAMEPRQFGRSGDYIIGYGERQAGGCDVQQTQAVNWNGA